MSQIFPPGIPTSDYAEMSFFLIINLDVEKVIACSPGVTVTMATLINFSFVLIGWLGRARPAELLRWFTLTVGIWQIHTGFIIKSYFFNFTVLLSLLNMLMLFFG